MVATENIEKLEDLELIETYFNDHNNFLQGGLYFETGNAFTIYASKHIWSSILTGTTRLLFNDTEISQIGE